MEDSMKIIDLALKDLLRSFRSMFAVGMMVVAPLIITGLMYFAFSGMASQESGEAVPLPDITVSVVNLDQPQTGLPELGALVVDFLRDPAMPDWLVVNELTSEAAARQAIDRQATGVAVIIPEKFSAVMGSGGKAEVTILHDPTLTVGPSIVKGLMEQFMDGISGAMIAYQVIDLHASENDAVLAPETQMAVLQRYTEWFTATSQNINHADQPILRFISPAGEESSAGVTTNPIGNILALTMAGQIIFFAFYTGGSSTLSLLNEDEEGTLARLFTTPTPRSMILIGKFIAVFFTVILQTLVLLVASALLFNIKWGQPVTMLLVVLGQVAAAGGLGILLISFLKSPRQAGPVLGGVLTVAGMLGGLFTVAVPGLPELFNTINLATPHGWVLRGWKLALAGAGPGEVLVPVLVSLAIGCICFAVGARIFRNRFA
jgi:ABC-2 type transport system permease protein